MKQITPHLKTPTTQIANVWLLTDSAGRRFLIDTGHALERLSLVGQLFAMGVRGPGDLTAILLTHRHSDHAGNAAFLRKRFGARVSCHENDAGVLRGVKAAPPLAGSVKQRLYERVLSAYEDRAPAFCEIDETFEEGSWKWGFTIIPVPGHTEGSVMIYHEPSQTLFSGDAILVGMPLRRRSKSLRLAEAGFSQDVESCHHAVRRFLRQLPRTQILCSGHGPALDENTEARLVKLLRTE